MTPAVLTVAELAWGIGRRERGALFIMLWAYFDESGHAASLPIVAMGGYMGTVEAFTAFEKRWTDFLAKYELPEFHASKIREMAMRECWPEQRVTDLMTDAVSAITTGELLVGIANAVIVQDYNRVIGSNAWLSERFGSPYQLCCCMSIETAHRLMRFTPEWSDEHVSVVLAKSEEFKGDVGRCKEMYVTREFFGDRIATVTTCAASAMAELQAADLHAYEAYKYAESRFQRQRISYGRLGAETPLVLPGYLDAAGLHGLGMHAAVRELGLKGAQEAGVYQHLVKCSAALIGTR